MPQQLRVSAIITFLNDKFSATEIVISKNPSALHERWHFQEILEDC